MQPERDIEKLLRAYAKQRGADAEPPLVLHPATRRLLQGEVARRYGAQARVTQPRHAWWVRGWAKWAWGAAALVVLAVVALQFSSHRETKPMGVLAKRGEPAAPAGAVVDRDSFPLLARSEPPSALSRVTEEQSPAALREASVDQTRAQAERDKSIVRPGDDRAYRTMWSAQPGKAELGDVSASAVVVQAPATEHRPGAGPSQEAVLGTPGPEVPVLSVKEPTLAEASTPAASQPPSAQAESHLYLFSPEPMTAIEKPAWFALDSEAKPKVAPQAVTGDTWQAAGGIAILNQRFTQVSFADSRRAARVPSGTDLLLNSFQFEQRGAGVRIVDYDGSVYTGAVQILPASAAQTKAAQKPRAAAPSRDVARRTVGVLKAEERLAQQQAVQNYRFNVSGTNRTFNQPLIFDGILVGEPVTNQAPLPPVLGGVGTEIVGQAERQAPAVQWRVQGRARLADGKEVEVNAIPQAP